VSKENFDFSETRFEIYFEQGWNDLNQLIKISDSNQMIF